MRTRTSGIMSQSDCARRAKCSSPSRLRGRGVDVGLPTLFMKKRERKTIMKTDVLIVGSGCSGLYCALQLPRDKRITIITKSDVKSSDSYLAQGGICMLKDETDYDSYFEDTMKAGHYENDRGSVEIMIRSSQDVIKDLLAYGVEFARDETGELNFTREGRHIPISGFFSTRILPGRRLPVSFWRPPGHCRM